MEIKNKGKKLYRLYVDESGDHSYGRKKIQKSILKMIDYPDLEGKKRYLGLTGCIIESERYKKSFVPSFETLKKKYFAKDPDDPDEIIILHREDMVNKKGPFWKLKDKEIKDKFNKEFLIFLNNEEYRVITVVIDKKDHIERYSTCAFHPYHYCLTTMLERFCGFLKFSGARGDVIAESRGGVEDLQLKKAYSTVYISGTSYYDFAFFQSVLTTKEIKIKPKEQNIQGLQLADLLAHPLRDEILVEKGCIPDDYKNIFGKKVCEIMKSKYNRRYATGKIAGYGKIFL